MELIRKTKVLLTDSTEFSIDMKVQNKPVIYIDNIEEPLDENIDYVCNSSDDAVVLLSKLLLETSIIEKTALIITQMILMLWMDDVVNGCFQQFVI